MVVATVPHFQSLGKQVADHRGGDHKEGKSGVLPLRHQLGYESDWIHSLLDSATTRPFKSPTSGRDGAPGGASIFRSVSKAMDRLPAQRHYHVPQLLLKLQQGGLVVLMMLTMIQRACGQTPKAVQKLLHFILGDKGANWRTCSNRRRLIRLLRPEGDKPRMVCARKVVLSQVLKDRFGRRHGVFALAQLTE